MANYDLTYEGSRVQSILDTGDELRDAGYIFRGEATPSTVPGTPTERVAYIGGPGTYTNFGSSITVGAGCICVFKYTGSAWSNQVINTGLDSAVNTLQNSITAINNNIGNGYVYAGVATPSTSPVTGKVFYLAVQAGTYTNFGSLTVTAGINILKYNGSTWSVQQAIGIDAEPTQGSANLVKSGGVLGSIIQNGPAFDLSAYNAQGGVLATYADLSAALTALNALPADFKKGGMSMKFVLSSYNKYMQFRCMTQNFTTDVTQWQGVDDKPTAGSDNMVKSGGVHEAVSQIGQNIDKLLLNGDVIITKLDPSLVWKNGYVATDGAVVAGQSGTYQFTDPIPVVKGQIIRAIGATGNSVNIISEYNNKIAVAAYYLSGEASGQSQIEYTCTDSGYVRLCCNNVGTATFEIISTKNCPAIIPEFSKLNYDIDDIYARLIGGVITKTEVVSTEWEQGYIGTNGSIVPQSSGLYYYSKQISVTRGDVIKFNHVDGQGINVISLFSSGGVYIEGVSYTAQDYSFECSQDGFVRVCCNNKDECEVLLTTTVNYHSQNSNLAHIKVGEWNFGVFNNGVSPAGIPDADVNTALPSIKHLLVSLNADILIATECPQYVNRGQTLDTYTTLLEQFFQYHKYGASGICIFSKYPFAVSDWVSPDDRTYQVGTISIGTTQIGFAAIHPRSASGSEAKQARITDMQAVISELSDYDKIIVSGDFNTYEDDELDCWRNSGFVLGNCGYFGDINTYPNSSREWYIDNIVTKGFNIDYFNRLEDTAGVSDHYPVLAKMTAFL